MNRRLVIIVLIGILIRIIIQFGWPSFNYDEITLGHNIKGKGFLDLLKPLDNYQSAPPLFLITQKLIYLLTFIPLIYRFKVLSFIVSSFILVLVYKILESKSYSQFIKISVLVCFSFSPFIVYHSLTLKQYGFDLLGLLFTYHLIAHKNNNKILFLSFLVWPLFSNIGLFFAMAYTAINVIKNSNLNSKKLQISWSSFKYSLGVLLYSIYFIWYSIQPGSTEMKLYMQKWWSHNFIPLDFSILKYIQNTIHGFSVYFFSSIHVIGYITFVLFLFGLYLFFKTKSYLKLSNIYLVFGVLIHIIFNIFKLYPFSDRLYLYLAVLFYFGIGYVIYHTKKVNLVKIPFYLMIFSWFLYLGNLTNNIIHLEERLKTIKSNGVLISQHAHSYVKNFYSFTEYDQEDTISYQVVSKLEQTQSKSGYIYVSRVAPKFGHSGKTGPKEPFTNDLLSLKKISLLEKIDGYDIYRVE